ncbi:MAG TPA: dipeptidase [Anaerolineae bacterium]|nr:dipeptidase [Anaerolineae bacterium]
MADLESALAYARDHQKDFLEEFISFLRIPSVSTLPDHKDDMYRAADWIIKQLESIGFESVAVMPTGGHPVVYGEWMKAGEDAPTILFYGHYDVQPPDPLELWLSEPFEPQLRGDDLFARGASDMKGQIVAHLKAVESLLRTSSLPINMKYLIEGEEEIGSPNLGDFITENENLLSCDLCLNGDSNILAPDKPAITFALRGLAYFEIRLQGAAGDLHSGTFGGAVDNPAIVLCKLIAGMRDETGRVNLLGFYDDVRPLSERERSEMVSMPDEWWMEQSGASVLFGEQGFTTTERATARPTLDVNGMISGFTGKGSKTVLPAQAMAKISMRLVPDQKPERIKDSLEAYLEANAPPTVTWELEDMASSPPAIVERDSDAVHAASRALEAVWGVKPVFQRQGGTVPVVGLVQELLGVDSLMLGFGLPDDNLHAPNEKLHLPNFWRGIETYIRFTCEFGS